MTNEERIAANAANGYILVKEFDGWEIYKKLNGVGGYTYYSDRIGYEGHYPIWDDCTRDVEELLTLVVDLQQTIQQFANRETELWKAFGNFCQAINNREP